MRILLVAVVLLSAQVAGAQDVAGRVQFGPDLTLFEFFRTSFDDIDELTVRDTQFTFLASGAGLSLGYSFSDYVSLSGRVLLARVSRTISDGASMDRTESVLNWRLGPRAEVRFNTSGQVRGFARFGVFLAGERLKETDEDTFSARFLGVEAGLGMHIFAGERLSFDPSFELAYRTQVGGEIPDTSAIRVGLHVGITAWLGGREVVPATTPEAQPLVGAAAYGQGERGDMAEPEISFARSGGRKIAVRLTVETRDSRVTMTYNPAVSTNLATLSFVARGLNRLPACENFSATNGAARVQAPIADSRANVPMNELANTLRGRPSARFCGRSWALSAAEVQAVETFVREARSILAEHQQTNAAQAPPAVPEPPAAPTQPTVAPVPSPVSEPPPAQATPTQ